MSSHALPSTDIFALLSPYVDEVTARPRAAGVRALWAVIVIVLIHGYPWPV